MKPYRVCVFTIRSSRELDDLFKKGGSHSLEEGRRWVGAQKQKLNAEIEGQSFLVIFAAAESVGSLIYYAIIDEIVTDSTENKTLFRFSNMSKFPEPVPHKTDLKIVSSGEYISDNHIRPYVICQTPRALIIPPKRTMAPPLTIVNLREEVRQILLEITDESMSDDEQLFSTDALAKHGRAIQEGRRRRVSEGVREAFQRHHNLSVTEDEVTQCEKVKDLVDLVERKFKVEKKL